MTSTPPDPRSGAQFDIGTPPDKPGSVNLPPIVGKRAVRRMSAYRILCGGAWAVISMILVIGFFVELGRHNLGPAMVSIVFAIGAGWYDYRVWTFRAKRLWFYL
jgi:hypothetical protein